MNRKGRIAQAFGCGKKVFIPYVTAGDPDLETTQELVVAMAEEGAGIIELGLPFSDPIAEGPVITAASLRALESGTDTDKIFDMVRQVRKKTDVPLAIMTYANPVFVYGKDKFAQKCSEVGIDGLIIPDVPFEESDEFKGSCDRFGIDLISMISPTSSKERMRAIAGEARGFLYCVSSLGVTGVRTDFSDQLDAMIGEVRKSNSALPVAIGFGISGPEQARMMSQLADGVIIGSAIVRIAGEKGRGCVPFIREFVRSVVSALEIR